MIQHRFLNEGRSPIPMGPTAEYACVCGRRGTYAVIERHIAENAARDRDAVPTAPYAQVTDDDEFGGDTMAHYLPIEPRKPAPTGETPPLQRPVTPEPSDPYQMSSSTGKAPTEADIAWLKGVATVDEPEEFPAVTGLRHPRADLLRRLPDEMNKLQELEAARNLEPDCDYGAVGAGRYRAVLPIPTSEVEHPRSIAELFQDMLRAAYQAGAVSASSGETFETWYQREVLQ